MKTFAALALLLFLVSSVGLAGVFGKPGRGEATRSVVYGRSGMVAAAAKSLTLCS